MLMKNKILFILFTILLSPIMSFYVFSQPVKHVVLISIDGFRPEFYKDSSWPAPNLQQRMTQGVYADYVQSVFPSITYPSHTTIITGAMPGRHGIVHNNIPEGNTGDWYWYEEAIETETLWDAIKKAGLTSAAVMWPVSVGAPIDYNIPVIRPSKNEKSTQLSITREVATPKGLLEEIEMNATGKLRPEIFNNKYLLMDENISRMGTYLIEKYKPAFTALHFISVDHVTHTEGKDGDKVKQAVALVDRAVGSVVEAIKRAGISENTAIIITGDHGFVNSHTRFHPNILLKEAGMMENVKEDNWKAKFQSAGGSASLYLRDKEDDKIIKKVKQLLADLPESQQKLFRIVDRKELDAIGADPDVTLAITGVGGVVFGGAENGKLFRPASGGAHGFFPDSSEIHTGFIGWGAGFKPGTHISFMGLEDIAPIVAELLNLEFDSLDGVLHREVLEEKFGDDK